MFFKTLNAFTKTNICERATIAKQYEIVVRRFIQKL